MDERLKVALISSLIIFLFGGLPSVLLNCWSWFGRSGALLVIYGVALAWYNFNHEHEFGKAVNDAHKTIDDHIDDDDVGRHKKFINEIYHLSKSQSKIIEFSVVCVGTLIWGYGDLAQKLFS